MVSLSSLKKTIPSGSWRRTRKSRRAGCGGRDLRGELGATPLLDRVQEAGREASARVRLGWTCAGSVASFPVPAEEFDRGQRRWGAVDATRRRTRSSNPAARRARAGWMARQVPAPLPPLQIRLPSGSTRPHDAVGSRTGDSRDDHEAVRLPPLHGRVVRAVLLLPRGRWRRAFACPLLCSDTAKLPQSASPIVGNMDPLIHPRSSDF